MIGGGRTPIHFLRDAADEEQFGYIINRAVLGYVWRGQALVIVGLGAFEVRIVAGINPVHDGPNDGRGFARVSTHDYEGALKDFPRDRLIARISGDVDVELALEIHNFPANSTTAEVDRVLNFNSVIRWPNKALSGGPGLVEGIIRLGRIHEG